MRLHISSSGLSSRIFARRLADWIPDVLQYVEASQMDDDDVVDPTRPSSLFIRRSQARDQFVIFCVTEASLQSAWLNFEAGILTARLDARHPDLSVATVLVDLEPADVAGPLSAFSPFKADLEGIRSLVRAINANAGDESIDVARLDRAFDLMITDILVARNEAVDPSVEDKRARSVDDKIDELLTLVRRLSYNRPQVLSDRDIIATSNYEALLRSAVEPGTVVTPSVLSAVQQILDSSGGIPVSALSDEVQLKRREVENAVLKWFRSGGWAAAEQEVEFVWSADAKALDLYTDLPISFGDMDKLVNVVTQNSRDTRLRHVRPRATGFTASRYARNVFHRFSGLSHDEPTSFIRSGDDDDDDDEAQP